MTSKRKIVIISVSIALIIFGSVIAYYIIKTGYGVRPEGKNIQQQGKTGIGNLPSEESEKDLINSNETTNSQTTLYHDPEGTQSDNSQKGASTGENTDSQQDVQNEEKTNIKKNFGNIKVKALYLTGPTVGKSIDHFIELVNTTELNALVIDIKEDGVVNYESDVPEVRNNGLFRKYYDVDQLIKKLHDNNIYVIGRIVCFKDNKLALKRPDLAIKRPNNTIWKENGTTAWLNPYHEETWKYNIDIAKEAVKKGFDEIQFDYVRFPAARNSAVDYGENVPSKVDAICGFLERAKKELCDELGAILSADVFAIVCESIPDGLAIGQDFEKVGRYIDYVCPMIYPSHYSNAASKGIMANGTGQSINGVLFKAPDLKPYDVVYQTLLKCKDRISKAEGYRAKVRPYLQDFTASYLPPGYYQEYGPEQLRQQVKAVYDAGYDEWILWDGRNTYSEGGLEKEPAPSQ